MKIVLHKGVYKVVDNINRVALLYNPLNRLDDIFLKTNGWKTGTKEVIEDYECEDVIFDNKFGIKSFKDLKHNVAAYLIKNQIEANIPSAYKRAYKTNKHLYDGRYDE